MEFYSDVDRSFKGVWIDKDIWLNPDLTSTDKLVYAEIWSLDTEEGCRASNEYLAEFIGCSERKIRDSISKLKNMGLIDLVKFDGRTRWLKVRVAKSATLKGRKCLPSNIVENKKKSINVINTKRKDGISANFNPNVRFENERHYTQTELDEMVVTDASQLRF